MVINYLAFAVPFFLFFIWLEYYVAKKQGKSYFKFNSSIANINVGIAERLIDLFAAGGFYFFYDYLHTNFAIFDIEPSILLWIALLLTTDFLWYWYHRYGHEVNLFWGFHVVHHQSEEFNYTAATRITIFQAVVRTSFWSVLPIIGFPVEMITTILLVHGIYPFFTHTRLIGKLGILEYIIVTPSHHRVHHASNEQYLDKNFGDMFIIWDKLFGTFVEEKEEPTYGLTRQLGSYSFLWQHFHFLVEIAYAVKAEKGFRNKLKVIFGRPADFNPDMRRKAEKKFLDARKVKAHTTKFRYYVIAQIAITTITLFLLLLFEHHIVFFMQSMIALFILITLINCGAILDQRRWVFYLEFVRASLVCITTFYYFPNPTLIGMSILLLLIGLTYFSSLQKQYLRLIYGKRKIFE